MLVVLISYGCFPEFVVAEVEVDDPLRVREHVPVEGPQLVPAQVNIQ